MNNQRLGFSISFLVHSAAAVFFLSMSQFVVQKPMVIDFSINGNGQEAGGSGPQSQKAEDEPQPVKPIARQREMVQSKPVEVPAPLAEAKEQVQEESPVSVPVQEKPIMTAAVAVNAEISGIPPLPLGNGNHEGAPSVAQRGPGNGDETGQGRKGDALENAKNLYLKEHFGYIRDKIMKNVSYPYIARKRSLTGRVVVSFIVCEKGFANDIKIVESSGYSILDNNAIETIKRASPFPKPPVRAELVMPIVYKML